MILALLQPPQDETTTPPPSLPSPPLIFSASSHAYAPVAPSRYASNTTLNPLTPNPLSAAYHPYAQVLDP
ncbi:hypothetical protein O181_013265 [Austropuccinia psidii MF-1]|uniref:Uncharacterized protein n=1 Tax=Austropuccinia psidii MF-1 TaxID=1389203 RepID=A0A9Q3BZI6_9BASI|nr:hypothetical protein [Austropuccinia psidii MF-1]